MTDLIYAVGDVHGEYEMLLDLIKQISAHSDNQPAGNRTLVMLGDYVDRGPHSAEVVEYLKVGEFLPTFQKIFLKGNHEDMLIGSFEDQDVSLMWKMNGGNITLSSYEDGYKVHSLEQLTQHAKWLNTLPTKYVHGPYVFVHAGIEPEIPIHLQRDSVVMWIRDKFLNYPLPHEYMVVHGHTPRMKEEVKHNRINVDTGACFSGGKLTSVCLNANENEIVDFLYSKKHTT